MNNFQDRHTTTPLVVRGIRFTRVLIHIVRGLATTAVVFPFSGEDRRSSLVQRWSADLLRMLAVEFERTGLATLPDRVVIVANHISWLDIFVLNASHPSRFIAKSDIRRWPVVGLLVGSVGTLFLDRTRRRDAGRINGQVMQALNAGHAIALFPEGTTTEGRELLPFHGSLLQPVIDAGGHVVPVAIRYTHLDGSHSAAPAYVGETSLVGSFRQLLRARHTRVRLHMCPPLAAHGRHRREIAADAHQMILSALQLPERSL